MLDHLYIPADKTNNYYKLKPEQYNKLLTAAIQKDYRKTNESDTNKVLEKHKAIAQEISLADRISITAKQESFITLKDHKDNFRNKPTCRLINPCKPELGKVSKHRLSTIVHEVRKY